MKLLIGLLCGAIIFVTYLIIGYSVIDFLFKPDPFKEDDVTLTFLWPLILVGFILYRFFYYLFHPILIYKKIGKWWHY